VEGKGNLHPDTRRAVDPFAAKSSRIVRLLLSEPHRGWQVQELAQIAGVSLGLVARVKQTLIEQALAEVRDRRVFLCDSESLLAAWSKAYAPRAEQISYYVMHRPAEVEAKISDWCASVGVRYALTQNSGAWRVAPMVRYNQATLYVDAPPRDGLQGLLAHIGAKPVGTGSNLSLWIPNDDFVFHGARLIDGSQVVSALQLYLDLASSPGRSAEAALEIFEREIRPSWQLTKHTPTTKQSRHASPS
jgi:hypothetical protein